MYIKRLNKDTGNIQIVDYLGKVVEDLMKVTEYISEIEDHNNGSIKYVNQDGFLHREDAPARTYRNGSVEWWLNGMVATKDECIKCHKKRLLREKLQKELKINLDSKKQKNKI